MKSKVFSILNVGIQEREIQMLKTPLSNAPVFCGSPKRGENMGSEGSQPEPCFARRQRASPGGSGTGEVNHTWYLQREHTSLHPDKLLKGFPKIKIY